MSDLCMRLSLIKRRKTKRLAIACIAVFIVVSGIFLDTKLVRIGSVKDVREQQFSFDKYGDQVFPDIQKNVESRAISVSVLDKLLKEDRLQAIEKYGVGSPIAVFPVSFTGIVKNGNMGIYDIDVAHLSESLRIRLQTGPAITGADLRDATGDIHFGDFKNQIEYQNAGASINQAMKKTVIASINTEALSGKTVKVVGVFRLLNPNIWLITPVRIDVQ